MNTQAIPIFFPFLFLRLCAGGARCFVFIFSVLAWGVVAFGGAGAVLAQESLSRGGVSQCDHIPEALLHLRPHLFASYSQWTGLYDPADLGAAVFHAIHFSGEDRIMAGGSYPAAPVRGSAEHASRALLVEIDRRGRVLRDNRHESDPSAGAIFQILDQKQGFMAVGEGRISGGRRAVRLAWYRDDGRLRRAVFVSLPDFDIIHGEIIPAIGGDGYVLAAQAVSRTPPQAGRTYAIAYRLDSQGRELWRRALDPGPDSRFSGVDIGTAPAGESFYLFAGGIKRAAGQESGFVMRLEPDGALGWTRTFPRGADGFLRRVAKTQGKGGDGLIVLGNIAPHGEWLYPAAWLMKLDSGGTPLWQRYVGVPEMTTQGRAIVGHEDGRVSVLLEASPAEGTEKTDLHAPPAHVRLLTLSPQGAVMRDESFVEGAAVSARGLAMSPEGHRVLAGQALREQAATEPDETSPDEGTENGSLFVRDGWILVAGGLEPFEDPCHAPAPTKAPLSRPSWRE